MGEINEDTLSLRVARSGTKLPAPVAMPWQAEACRPCLEAKDRRLPSVFLCSRPSCTIQYTFSMSFADNRDSIIEE